MRACPSFTLLVSAIGSTIVNATSCSQGATDYDFIIVGGGTAGVAVAARLNQRLPSQCILVIEAGPDAASEPRINIPGFRGSTVGTVYDWNFTVTPQPGLNDRAISHPRGRVLGGSSALNLMTWDRASVAEFDAWEELGNPGWNWNSMYPAMLNVETFNRTFLGPGRYGEEGVGNSGPVNTFINEQVPIQQEAWIPAMESLGISQNLESLNGNPLGVMYQPSNIHRKTYSRSYSTSYLDLANTNLHILTNTTVAKVLISQTSSSPIATGVLLTTNTTLTARKEVILAAGSFQTPQLLELSGIGDPTILAAANITPLVPLPSVGENLQDHLRIQNAYQLRPNYTSTDILRFNATRAAQELALYHADQPSLYRYTGSSYAFLTLPQALGNASADMLSLAATAAGPDIVSQAKLRLLSDARVPQLELIFSDGYTGAKPYPASTSPDYGKMFVTVIASVMHPLARGSVHVNASAPAGKPVIDPRYLSNEYDLQAVKRAAMYMRRVANTEPIRGLWAAEFDPGDAVQTDEEWVGYVRDNTGTIFHPVGTAAMLPKKDGGVVDAELRVYGVGGLRVVDASVIPMLISAHIQTAVYGIAERAAEIIAKRWEGEV